VTGSRVAGIKLLVKPQGRERRGGGEITERGGKAASVPGAGGTQTVDNTREGRFKETLWARD